MTPRLGIALTALLASASAAHAWEPTKAIEIVVPFSAGGASDQMARTIQGIIQKNGLVSQPIVIVNKPAAAGGEAMLDIKASPGDAHKLITTSSGIFMTPMTSKLPVTWKDFTPVAMLAQDAFGLWVNGASPHKTAGDFVTAAKSANPPLKVGGTGAKREDQLLSIAMEKTAGIKLSYIPHQGGGAASVQLAGKHLEATTNNPAEEFANWRSGSTRPLCVFSEKRMTYGDPVAGDQSWADIPTCREQGLDVSYQMLRGMFMPGKVTAEQQAFYVNLFKRVSETADWKEYLARNALVADFRAGEPFVEFLKADEKKHEALLSEAGFLVAK
ncbi:tripartite tricarboxylate transporter substrate-binding protein [Azospirillum sp. SYSU D00513]|uniref:tripartite tricarboxylate transporter substrate binding protein n=1 Tax=Azospirillum sp. SYSU D00513 TaxID=2812561 RepID=UPI001A96EC1D|nr:tripartite tricarboxylate transporter substrate-binding protein [Azospirillum sp. SYSU D00513]